MQMTDLQKLQRIVFVNDWSEDQFSRIKESCPSGISLLTHAETVAMDQCLCVLRENDINMKKKVAAAFGFYSLRDYRIYTEQQKNQMVLLPPEISLKSFIKIVSDRTANTKQTEECLKMALIQISPDGHLDITDKGRDMLSALGCQYSQKEGWLRPDEFYTKAKDHVQVLDLFFSMSDLDLFLSPHKDFLEKSAQVVVEALDSDGWSHAWFFDVDAITRNENPKGWHFQFDASHDATFVEALINAFEAQATWKTPDVFQCKKQSFEELPYEFSELPEDVRQVYLTLAESFPEKSPIPQN